MTSLIDIWVTSSINQSPACDWLFDWLNAINQWLIQRTINQSIDWTYNQSINQSNYPWSINQLFQSFSFAWSMSDLANQSIHQSIKSSTNRIDSPSDSTMMVEPYFRQNVNWLIDRWPVMSAINNKSTDQSIDQHQLSFFLRYLNIVLIGS